MTTTERSGRPRDPAVDQRIITAAIEVFAHSGWAAFSIDAVARDAGVGKASIYLRWPNKEELLTDAVATVFEPISTIDTGELREDLILLARLLLDLYGGRHGLAARRMTVESEATPGIAARWKHVRQAQISAARGIVRRAVERGELPARTPVTLVLDTLCGAAMLQPVAVPDAMRARAADVREKHAAELVDFVLAAARNSTPHHPAGEAR